MTQRQGEFEFDQPPGRHRATQPAPLSTDADVRQRALHEFQRNVIVTAGAGTGKTSLLVGRLISAMVRHHMEPARVLAVTFTENAAAEMRDRLARMLSAVQPWLTDSGDIEASDRATLELLDLRHEDLRRVEEILRRRDEWQIATFHGFCLRFLQSHAAALDLPPELHLLERQPTDLTFVTALSQFIERTASTNPEALQRFEARDLLDLAHSLLDLPEESWGKVQATHSWPAFDERRSELAALLADHPAARPAWRRMADQLLQGYQALLHGNAPPQFDGSTPKAGKREVGEELSDYLQERLHEHRELIRHGALASDRAVVIAVDYLQPFLRAWRHATEHRGELTFDDLLLRTRRALLDNDDLRHDANERYSAILVDEFQDTDPLQYDILFLLAARAGSSDLRPCLFIVGDAKQSIYRFRRADIAAFGHAIDELRSGGALNLELRSNFRSRAPVLDFVNQLCRGSLRADPPYQFGFEPVEPTRGPGPEVQAVHVESTQATAQIRRNREGAAVVEQIRQLRAQDLRCSQIAVLLRAATDLNWLLQPLRQAGIPYALEGSRRFYQRQEVQLATALLTAVARPQDPTAVLAVLRSPLTATTDQDIAAYLLSDESGPAPTLDYESAPALAGRIGAAFQFLANLRHDISGMPLPDALNRILACDELLIAGCTDFESAQSMGNLDRMRHRLLEGGFCHLEEIADALDADIRRQTDDEESSLYGSDQDVVRIMTVHKAKGLEFDAVIVPDLARQDHGDQQTEITRAERLFDVGGTEIVSVRIGAVTNLYHVMSGSVARRHALAESRRLFYVAATRAKERLILICGDPPAKANATWLDDLRDSSAHSLLKWQEASETESSPAPTTTFEANNLLEAVDRHRQTVAQHSHRPLLAEVAPSSTNPDDGRPAGTHDGDEARRVGIAVHSYLGVVDLNRPTLAGDLLDSVILDQDLKTGAVVAVRQMLEQFHAAGIRDRLRRATRLQREVPLSFRHGTQTVHGFIDVVFTDDEERVYVLDWKTDRVADATHSKIASRYQPQLKTYAAGVAEALDLKTPPTLLLHFLRDDITVELEP